MHPIESAQIAELRREQLVGDLRHHHVARAAHPAPVRPRRRPGPATRSKHVLTDLHLRPARAS